MSSVRFARRYLLYSLIGTGALVPATGFAQQATEKVFIDTLFASCNASTDPNFLTNVCAKVFVGGLAGGTYVPGLSVVNAGSTGSYSSSSKPAAQREFGEEEVKKDKKKGGASGDFKAGPFGGFITAQTSKTERALTDLENGYDAKLNGVVAGLDRRFGNNLITGLSLGYSKTDSTYLNDSGTSDAKNTTLMLYSTYLPTPRTYLGGYLGGGVGTLDATRRILSGTIVGTATSKTDTSQAMAGLSTGYYWYSGGLTVALNAGADYVKNKTDGNTESGTTGLEFIYPEATTTSLTGTLGTRVSYRQSFTWGAIAPFLRAAYVHEFKNDARTVSPRLVSNPSTVFAFQTDFPDRNYYIGGAGATIEMGRGTQLFVDYEKRGGDMLIDTWAASVGLILEF